MVTTVNKQSKRGPRRKHDKYDEYAWFIVFLLALSYFINSRRGGGGLLSSLSKPYDIIASSITMMTNNDNTMERRSEEVIRSIFYISSGENKNLSDLYMSSSSTTSTLLTLERRLEIILSSPLDILIHDIDQQCIITNNITTTTDKSSSPYFSYISSTTWVHDTNIGRGYLLLADVGRSGRIWRWEVGGGPITIGRSLHMERSGCRSHSNNSQTTTMACPENLFTGSNIVGGGSVLATSSSCQQDVMVTTTTSPHPPLLGSASLAVEIQRDVERASAGRNLIVAEWGERRIVRVEGETGARTPLIITVPNHDVNADIIITEEGKQRRRQRRRVFRPNHLTYSPFGDLLFSDTFSNDNDNSAYYGVVYRRKEAVHVVPIAVERSRDAHGWTSTTGDEDGQVDNDDIDILFQTNGSIEGMTLGLDFSTLYVLVVKDHIGGWTKMLHKVPLGSDDEDEEDSGDDDGGKTKSNKQGITLLYEMTSSDCGNDDATSHVDYASVGSKLTIDEKGVIYMVTCPSSVTLLSLSQDEAHMVGILALDKVTQVEHSRITPKLTSVGFGEDGYLYLTTANELMRVKIRVSGGLSSLPTNMVLPSQSTKK